jgi:hypothetical protein
VGIGIEDAPKFVVAGGVIAGYVTFLSKKPPKLPGLIEKTN